MKKYIKILYSLFNKKNRNRFNSSRIFNSILRKSEYRLEDVSESNSANNVWV